MSFLNRRGLADPIYLASKLWLYGRSRLELRSNDIMIAAYPKTGSTWLRFMLYHYLSQREVTATFDEVNAYMPEFGHPSVFGKWPFEPVPRLIKTHRSWGLLFRSTQAVLMIRDPRDIMVSRYYHARGKRPVEFEGRIGELLRDPQLGLVSFFEHFCSWAPRVDLIVRYEDLKNEPRAGVRRILELAGVAVDDDRLDRAISLSSVMNMRQAQVASKESFRNYDRGFVFARAARSAQWMEHFDLSDRQYYARLAENYGFDLYTRT